MIGEEVTNFTADALVEIPLSVLGIPEDPDPSQVVIKIVKVMVSTITVASDEE